jgi:hypothetical protein
MLGMTHAALHPNVASSSVHGRVEGAVAVAMIDAGALFAHQWARMQVEWLSFHGSLCEVRKASA